MTRPSTSEYVIHVPGIFRHGTAYLDLETVKVSTIDPRMGRGQYFVMQNGEILRQRWSIAMYGVAINGFIRISDNSREIENITGLGDALEDALEVVYAATRGFDELICKGRFTNARRAPEPKAFFPAVPGASGEHLCWRNLREIPWTVRRFRGLDIDSATVPRFLESGVRLPVQIHLLRDVVSLILTDTDDGNQYPDSACRDWCEHIMQDYEFAKSHFVGGEER